MDSKGCGVLSVLTDGASEEAGIIVIRVFMGGGVQMANAYWKMVLSTVGSNRSYGV